MVIVTLAKLLISDNITLVSTGLNVNTPVPWSYAKAPGPFAAPVVTESVNGSQTLPLYFSSCPVLGVPVVTSVRSLRAVAPPPVFVDGAYVNTPVP